MDRTPEVAQQFRHSVKKGDVLFVVGMDCVMLYNGSKLPIGEEQFIGVIECELNRPVVLLDFRVEPYGPNDRWGWSPGDLVGKVLYGDQVGFCILATGIKAFFRRA